MEKCNNFYTTVTVSDFHDTSYINDLINNNIGLELALLAHLSGNASLDLENLKKEMADFCHFFDLFKMQRNTIRVHQPGGYMYYWSDRVKGLEALNNFFNYCCDLGFQHFIIHTPYGNSSVDENKELEEFRKKLGSLVPNSNLEVEEISTSNKDLSSKKDVRFYSVELFEELMKGQKATMLLDVYECGGVEKTVQRMKYLASKGFKIKTIHLHKDKHKFLTSDEFEQLLKSARCMNFVNEGFIKANSSFDEFVKTKSVDCIVSNNERMNILKGYREKY